MNQAQIVRKETGAFKKCGMGLMIKDVFRETSDPHPSLDIEPHYHMLIYSPIYTYKLTQVGLEFTKRNTNAIANSNNGTPWVFYGSHLLAAMQ